MLMAQNLARAVWTASSMSTLTILFMYTSSVSVVSPTLVDTVLPHHVGSFIGASAPVFRHPLGNMWTILIE